MPAKPEGACWDACGRRRRKDLKSIVTKLGALAGPKGWIVATGADVAKWAMTGSKAPDAFVTVDFGQGRVIRTHHVRDTLVPTWSVSSSFPLGTKATALVKAWDKDTRFDDPIASGSFAVPADVLRSGGNWVLRFGSLYELVINVALAGQTARGFESGRYRVTIAKGVLESRKSKNGKAWDGFGGKPDPFVLITFGAKRIRTGVLRNELEPVWSKSKELNLSSDDEMSIHAWDKDALDDDPVGSCSVGKLSTLSRTGVVWTGSCGDLRQIVVRFDRLQ